MQKLTDLTVNEFLAKTSSSDPVPGGGSISALNGAIAAALGHMVANLTLGRKKYVDVQTLMEELSARLEPVVKDLSEDIDRDSDAYNEVFAAFKYPKETEEEKALRNIAIQKATVHAAEVPLGVARKTLEIMPLLEELVEKGNQNAVTDACVATMCARTAVLGALMNVKINLGGLDDEEYVTKTRNLCATIQAEALEIEGRVLAAVAKKLDA